MGQDGSCAGSSSRRSSSSIGVFWAAAWALLLLLLMPTAAQLDPQQCYLTEEQLGPAAEVPGVCNATCRAETLAALQGIYAETAGPTWNFNVEDDNGTKRNQGGWMQCPAGGCQPASVELDGEGPYFEKAFPSYCCWEGVLCCHEHSVFMTGSSRTPCTPYSVFMLQLRAGNLTRTLNPIMPHLETLHRNGLAGLDLSRNMIVGSLPQRVTQLENLQLLLLGANNISGTVPNLSPLKQLRQLDLEFNFLSGRLSGQQLCPPGNRLNALMLRANNFTGPLDLRTCQNLTVLDVQDNGFSGSIPLGRSNMALHMFRARNNYFGGSIPDDFWELPQLISVDLSNNSLTGTLAETIGTTSFLTNLYLGGNQLRGTIPAGMTTSSQLTNVDLSNNAWIVGPIPSLRWMLGLQALDLSNTRIRGTIPEELGNLPFLMSVDIRNTLMSCCSTLDAASDASKRVSANGSVPAWRPDQQELLPPFLQFNLGNKRSPVDERMPRDAFLRSMMATGENVMCPTVMRAPGSNPDSSTVYRPADLRGQQWLIDPEYYFFQECDCAPGYDSVTMDATALASLWCEDRAKWTRVLGLATTNATYACSDMSLQVCKVHVKGLSSWHYVLVSVASLVILCLCVMLASLFVSLCLARTGKVRRQVEWWRKHLSGMPQTGKMSIVVTDIEGYSDLFKRCPEPMYEALTLHNNVIRRAKYANCGSTVQQEGDSYTLVFHEPLDAVAFCLQAQLALMEVAWPEGLYDDSSTHSNVGGDKGQQGGMRTRSSKGKSKLLGGHDSRKGSLLPSGPSGWLRKSRPALKQSASDTSVASVGPPSPTPSMALDRQLHAPIGDVVGSPGPAGAAAGASLAWRSGNISRARMLELFSRVTGSGGGTGEAALFNGLRVRMGIVTGVVEGTPDASAPAANITNSALYKLALDVSDAGSGGQVLMDEASFVKVKEDLRPLGAVTSSGINYNKLAERVSLFHLLCLGSLCTRRSRSSWIDLDEAMVLDMGQYATPAPTAAAAAAGTAAAAAGDKKAPPPAGPPKLAGMLVRASLKLTGWGPHNNGHHHHHHQQQQQQHPRHAHSLSIPEPAEPWGDHQQQQQQLATTPQSLPGSMPAGAWDSAPAAAAAGGTGTSRVCPACRAAGSGGQLLLGNPGSPAGGKAGGRLSPDAAAAAAAAAACSVCGSSGSSSGGGRRVRLIQVLSPSLVGRAHVWGGKLSLRSGWVCVDAPYFEAPGALEAPLGTVPPTRFSSRYMAADSSSALPLATAASITPTTGSFVSIPASSQQSAPQLLTQAQQQQHQQQQQESQAQRLHRPHSCDGAIEQQQQQQQQQQQLQGLGLQEGASGISSIDSTAGTGSRSLSVWPSIREDVACTAAATASPLTQQQQQQQVVVPVSAFSVAANQQQAAAAADVAAHAAVAAAAAARLLRQPIPPVTMVFMLVEGAKVLGQRRKQLVKDIHGVLSQMLMLALKHVQGGYMCRMQEGDLKYMVAFSSARAALEWCLVVQEAAMYLDWPAGLSKTAQLRSEYDADSQLVFRGPRLKMGVCEGVPQSIIPNHEGRADYHGSSINQAARFMDAAAHGGQIACELDLALSVIQQWNSCSSSSGSGNSGDGCVNSLQQQQQEEQAGLGPAASAAYSVAADDDSLLLPPGAAASPAAASSQEASVAAPEAAEAEAAAGDGVLSPTAGSALTASAGSGSSSTAHEAVSGGSGSRFPWPFKGGSGAAAATPPAAANGCAHPPSAAAASATATETVAHEQQQQQQQQQQVAQEEPQPRLFQLPAEQVDRAPAAVQVYHLGLYKFKGSPQPLPMVNVTLASLAGRVPLFPKDPPKGKGGRVSAREGLAASCAAARLPALAQAYRARVPLHVLERAEFIAALHGVVGGGGGGAVGAANPGSPRTQQQRLLGQFAASMRSASMPPVRNYSSSSSARGRPPLPNLGSNLGKQQQQQQQREMQLAALEGGFGPGGGGQQQQQQQGGRGGFSSSTGSGGGLGSPLGSPTKSPLAGLGGGRSSSFSGRVASGRQGAVNGAAELS